jgi:glycosyltransferase involved in cell wall biosynthesis
MRKNNIEVDMFSTRSPRHGEWDEEEVASFLFSFDRRLTRDRPDALLTFAAGDVGRCMIDIAKRHDIIVVAALHNFSYTDPYLLRNVDYAYVPSEFSRDYYWKNFSISCHVLPNPVDPARVCVSQRVPRFLTFVNPSLEKGVYAFARIVSELSSRRPDIPILVVEARGTRENLMRCGIEAEVYGQLHIMPHTADPRRFWGVSRVCVMPSLWRESHGLVAVEAMSNGVPVIASDRGALPETLADTGFLLPLPDWMTPETDVIPEARAMAPWIEAIIRLWDDPALYLDECSKARRQATQWHPDRVRSLFTSFFCGLHHQPGPPVVPVCEVRAVGL